MDHRILMMNILSEIVWMINNIQLWANETFEDATANKIKDELELAKEHIVKGRELMTGINHDTR